LVAWPEAEYMGTQSDNGNIVGARGRDPASLGGHEWVRQTDGQRIYVLSGIVTIRPYTLVPSGRQITWGGGALWMLPQERSFGRRRTPIRGHRNRPVSVQHGVMYEGSQFRKEVTRWTRELDRSSELASGGLK